MLPHAIDPLNISDTVGSLHRFYVDRTPPILTWEIDPTIGQKNGIATRKLKWDFTIKCTDDNPVVRCQDVQWIVQSGTNSTEWKSSTKSTTPNVFVASINLVGPDELKNIAFRSFDGVGNLFDVPNNVSVALLLDTAPPVMFIAPMFAIVETNQNTISNERAVHLCV